MSNYHYLGRRSFPLILVGVVAALVVAVGAIVTYLHHLSWRAAALEEQVAAEERKFNVRRELEGTNLEMALRDVEKFIKAGRSPAGVAELDKNLSDARYNRMQRARLVALILQEEASMDDVEKLLREYAVSGLAARADLEDRRRAFLKAFNEGSDRLAEAAKAVDLKDVAPEIVKLLAEDSPLPAKYHLRQGAEAVLKEMKAEAENAKSKIGDISGALGQKLKAVEENYGKRGQTFKELSAALAEKRDAHETTLWGRMEEQKKQWDGFQDKTRESIRKKRDQAQTVVDKEKELEYLARIISARKADADTWMPSSSIVDGRVLVADPKLRIAILDTGRVHGLRLGQGFDVLRMKGDARQETKGRVVVRELGDNVSLCKIVAQDELNPIASGDIVANGKEDQPFDRRDPPKYALRGRFGGDVSVRLARTMVERSGGVLMDGINELTSFLVAGEDVKPEDIKLSQDLGIRVVRAPDLAQHLGLRADEVRALDEKAWSYR